MGVAGSPAHLQLSAGVGHTRLVAGFDADHCEYGRNDQEADCVVDAVDHGNGRWVDGAPEGSGEMPAAGLNPAQQLAVAAAQLQVAAWILMGQAATQLLSNVMSLSGELSNQSKDLILHVQRSLWAAEWRTDRLR